MSVKWVWRSAVLKNNMIKKIGSGKRKYFNKNVSTKNISFGFKLRPTLFIEQIEYVNC
jgi:hypothetical protein